MEQLNLQERTGCVTSVGELIGEKLPSIREALSGGTHNQPSTHDNSSPARGRAGNFDHPSALMGHSPFVGEISKHSSPKLGEVSQSDGEVCESDGEVCNNDIGRLDVSRSTLDNQMLDPNLNDLAKALKRGAYKTLQGEVSATKLVETAQPQMDTLVEPLLPRVGIVSLVGSSDSGKSSLLRGLALAVASGADQWLGLPLRTEHQRALYISTEDDEGAIATLLHKQNEELRLGRGDMAGLNFMFDTDNLTLRLEMLLKERPVDLVVVDAFSDLYRGSLNENNQVRTWLQVWHDMAQKHGCLVIFLHHTGKRTEALLPSKHNSIGSQGFEAKMRLMMELRTDQTDPTLRHLCVVKGNYLGPEWKNKSLVLRFSPSLNFTNTGQRVGFEELIHYNQSSDYHYTARRGSEARAQEKEERYGQIMDLIAEGLTYQQIADQLGYAHKSSISRLIHSCHSSTDY